MKMQDEP